MVVPVVNGSENKSTIAVDVNDKNISENNSETIDSGMDEDSNPGSLDAGDKSDDEDIVIRKPKKSMQRMFDDDSDVSQDVPDTTEKKQEFTTAEEVLEAVMKHSSDDESENEINLPSAKKKKVLRPVSDGSSSDSSDDGENDTLLDTIKKTAAENSADETEKETSTNDGNKMAENVQQEKTPSSQHKVPDNLFDDENSDSDSSSSKSSSGSDSDKSDSEKGGDDEGFDESSIDPKLLAKLKKGAAKKAPRERSQRIKKNDVTSIHSETQRIVRESRVNLPYHKPAPKSLNDFLARASKKQQEYKVLKGCRQSTAKAQVLQDILEKTRIQSKPKTQEELDKYSDSDEDWNPDEDKEKSLKQRLDERSKNKIPQSSNENGGKIEEDSHINEDNIELVKDNVKNIETDSLPDIDESEADKVKGLSQDLTKDPSEKSKETLIDSVSNDIDNNDGIKMFTNTNECFNSTSINEDQCKDVAEDVLFDWEKTDKQIDNDKMDTEENTSVIDLKSTENCENIDPNMQTSDKTSAITSPKPISSPNKSASKRKNKAKLAALAGIDLDNVKPCLSGHLETFISLEEAEETPKHPGVLKLMDRLCKHSAKQEKKHSKDMAISIISKDKTGLDKEELKLNTFTYHIEEEESNPLSQLETPGAKLIALKEQLHGKIREKRELARQRRQEEFDMYNDEGRLEEEKEEEEMSDHSDTDVEEDDFEEHFDDDEEEIEEEEEEEEEEEKERNPFADNEAEEDDEGVEGDDEAVEGDDEAEDEDDMNLKLDMSDDELEEGNEETAEENSSERKCQEDDIEAKSDADSTFKEPFEKNVPEKPFSMFGSRTRENSLTETQFQSAQNSSSVIMPIEDSQDLYGAPSTIPSITHTQRPPTQQSQDFNFFLEDSQSNMLDADGYLKTKSTGKKSTPPSLPTDDFSATQGGNMDELLGLCSGRFAGTQVEGKDKASRKSLFDESSASNTQGNMDELMGLCSGMFSDGKEKTQSKKKHGTKRKVSDDDDSGDSIAALSDNEDRNKDKEEESDNDEVDGGSNEGGDTDHIGSDDEEEQQVFTGFTVKNKHGKIRQEFVEEEAELSGSEFDSDENLDIPEEEDIMEMEEGDKDAAKMDQDQLRDEVGRVHLKQLIDEDKRELLRYQEMYLPDGDLHSEGGGRTRKFKWSNMDDDTQQDMFGDGSDGEPEIEENDTDFQWRKDRYEREQFIKEQQEKENNEGDNSQFLKLGKVFLRKQGSLDASQGKEKTDKTDASSSGETPGFPGSFYKLSNQKRGSFLARSKEALAKIAEMTKPVVNPSAGAKSGGNFTFQVISPEKGTEVAESPKGRQRKAHATKQKIMETRNQKPPAKKQKLDSQKSFTGKSIFHHL